MSNSLFKSETNKIDIQRIAALWAFSEATFGGILHALKIPFTGLFLGSAAVLFITIIAYSAENKSTILHTTLIVILVKAAINPYSPVTVYVAIAFEGVAGYLFFSLIPYKRLAAVLLGFFSLLYSALQKIIILTIIFGTNFWKSLDSFADSVLIQFSLKINMNSFSFSILIICLYTSLHILMGLYVGWKSSRIKDRILERQKDYQNAVISLNDEQNYFNRNKKKRYWWKRISGIIIILFLIAVMVYSYLYPHLSKIPTYEILFMLVRSIVITLFWFLLISPLLLKVLKKYFHKKEYKNLKEIEMITSLFPLFNRIINYCWINSSELNGLRRIRKFIVDSFLLIISIKADKLSK